MAVHMVKCLYCGKSFDRDKEPFVKVGARRYAHKECAESQDDSVKQEEIDKENFFKCVKSIYGPGYNYVMINKQALNFWFYNINHGNLEEGHGGIGIIPYIYEDVRKYYQQLYTTQYQNSNKQMRQQVVEFNIVPPKPKRPAPRLLDLGDE